MALKMKHFSRVANVFESTYSWVFGDCDLSAFVSVTQVITLQRYPSTSKLVMLSFLADINTTLTSI